jgi:hypothetical protein
MQIETLLGDLRDGAVDLQGAARQLAHLIAGDVARRAAVKQLLEQALAENRLALPQYTSLLAAVDGLTMLRAATPRPPAQGAEATTLRNAAEPTLLRPMKTAEPTTLRSGGSAQAPADAPPAATGPGTWVRARYVLEQMIGSGGMGQVWKAKDSYLERTNDPFPFVAIKLLNASIAATCMRPLLPATGASHGAISTM